MRSTARQMVGDQGLKNQLRACMLMLAIGTWALSAAVTASPVPAGAAAAPVLPSSDPFYSFRGGLTGLAPGAVMKSRIVSSMYAPGNAGVVQLLYRTTGELGQPSIMVATVIRPKQLTGPTRIVSYQFAYDGLGDRCDPSYSYGIGSFSSSSISNPFIDQYVKAGYTVVLADYEGEDLEYGAGHKAGYGTLDGIRAAETWLKASPASTPVGLVGYSGGAIASEYAAELAPHYAPDLDIVGAAVGGVAVDYAHSVTYINGSTTWSPVIPMVLVGLNRALQFGLDDYLSAFGKRLTDSISSDCLTDVMASMVGKGVTYQELLKPRYRDMLTVPAFAKVFNRFIMGTSGTPKEPLLLANGDSDGTGDGVVPVGDLQELAYTYCRRGVSLQLQVYRGVDHTHVHSPFFADAFSFLTRRFGGLPVADGCMSIESGTSLTPLKVAGRTSG